MNPAQAIIDKFGGVPKVAKICGVDDSRVYRWTYPKKRGGTGGTVPQKHIQPLILAARARDISLKLADFFHEHDSPEGDE